MVFYKNLGRRTELLGEIFQGHDIYLEFGLTGDLDGRPVWLASRDDKIDLYPAREHESQHVPRGNHPPGERGVWIFTIDL